MDGGWLGKRRLGWDFAVVKRCLEVVFFSGELPSLKLTAKAPENGWLEYFRLSFLGTLFSGYMLVLGRVP